MYLIIRRANSGPTDKVIAWMPLPDEAVLRSVNAEIHVVGAEGNVVDKFYAYGLSGHLMQVDGQDLGRRLSHTIVAVDDEL